MADTSKDTVYIDVDDEITGIIDKVGTGKHKIVALVLPKRATTLQSIVNMKLLKRAGEEANKRIVLITSEANLIPLAGIVGLHVAKTLQSKPAVPPAPDTSPVTETLDDKEDAAEAEVDPTKSVGELAGLPKDPQAGSLGAVALEETIDIDDPPVESAAGAKKSKGKKNKIRIPNFESFRLRLILGAMAVVILAVGYVLAFTVLPKAKVIVKTDTRTITSTLNFTANTAVQEADIEKAIFPAEAKEVKKTDTMKIAATGQKNIGEKSTGTVQLYNCNKEDKLSDTSRTVPAGTGVSSGGLTFLLVADVLVEPSSYVGNSCQSNKPSVAVSVTAQNSGEQYNLSARSYAVSGFPSMTAAGSVMTGGTTHNVTVVSQQDLDSAKAQIADKSKEAALTELVKALTDDQLIALPESIEGNDPALAASPKLGEEAGEVSITSERTFTMLGMKEEHLKTLIENDAKKQLDIEKQPIVDLGLDEAVYQVTSKRSGTDQSLSAQVVATAGAKLDPETIKSEIKGKKRGEARGIIEAQPGVKEVDINFSPFWVSKIPGKTTKIEVVFEQIEAGGQ